MKDADYPVDGGRPDREDSFVMDGLGNRTGSQTLSDDTVSFTAESLTNHYTAIAGSPVTPDHAGNSHIDKKGCTYSYDYENRVVKIKDSSNNDVTEHAYDALGRRIRMIDKAAEPWKRGLTLLITSRAT